MTAGGMSGCHRLWPGTAWSRIERAWSTEKHYVGHENLTFRDGANGGAEGRR